MAKKDTQVQDAPQEFQETQEQPVKERVARKRFYLFPRLGKSIEAESAQHAVELAHQQKGNG